MIRGGLTASIDSTLATLGETNNNTVRFDLAEKSRLYSKITYGGRSAQLDSILGSTVTVNTEKGNVTTTAIHKGFKQITQGIHPRNHFWANGGKEC